MRPEAKKRSYPTSSSQYPEQPIDSAKTDPEKRNLKRTVVTITALVLAFGAAVWIFAFLTTDYYPS